MKNRMAMYGRFKAGFYVSFIDRLKLRFKNNKIYTLLSTYSVSSLVSFYMNIQLSVKLSSLISVQSVLLITYNSDFFSTLCNKFNFASKTKIQNTH